MKAEKFIGAAYRPTSKTVSYYPVPK